VAALRRDVGGGDSAAGPRQSSRRDGPELTATALIWLALDKEEMPGEDLVTGGKTDAESTAGRGNPASGH